ncbi:MAG: MFS transporter [Halanaeroarchaeum sp.]
MLVTVSVSWAFLQAGRFAFSPLLPRIVADLEITTATAGLALTLLQIVYAVVQYPSGQWSDALGRATIIVPALVVLILGFSLIGLATTVGLFVAGVVVIGVGKGLIASPERALLFDLFETKRGRALGIFAAGTDVGGLLASGLAIVALSVAGWRATFLPVVLALLATTVLFLAVNREPYRFERPTTEFAAPIRRLFTTREQVSVVLAFSLFYVMVSGFLNFFPTYLAATKGFSEASASGMFAVVFVVGMVIKPVVGTISDRFSRPLVAIGGFLVAAGALVGILFVQATWLLVLAVVFLAIGYKTQFPIADAIVMEAAPDESMGGDLGAARAVFLGIGSLGPVLIGTLASRFDFTVAFGVLVVSLLTSAALLTYRYGVLD